MADAWIGHLLRRGGFGASAADAARFEAMSGTAAVDALLNFGSASNSVDALIGRSGFVGVTARGQFEPNTNITDARQRWLFRMVHSESPMQEKMALYRHNHFATAYSKVACTLGASDATRVLAAKPSEVLGGM
jgi:uncharacterized protein (DUF1800 family)